MATTKAAAKKSAAKKSASKNRTEVLAAAAEVLNVITQTPADDEETKTYTVLRRIHYHADVYLPTDLIELADDEAAGLLTTKAIEPYVDVEPVETPAA